MDVAALIFDHIDGAEGAFANARDQDPAARWHDQIAFVEVHRKGRIVVRGTIAAHYVDVDDEGDLIGRDTGIGTLVGAVVGFALGPMGFAVGLVAGGAIGGRAQASHIPKLDGAFFDEIRADLPERSSAIVLFAEPEDVDAMVAAFEGSSAPVVRYRLSRDALAELEAALAATPTAAPPPTGAGAA
jgi:uncharacterized membrane protein